MPALAPSEARPTAFETGSRRERPRRGRARSMGIGGLLLLVIKSLVWLAVVGTAIFLIAK